MIAPWRFAAAVVLILVGAVIGILWSIPGTANGATLACVLFVAAGLWLGMRSPRDTLAADACDEEVRRG